MSRAMVMVCACAAIGMGAGPLWGQPFGSINAELPELAPTIEYVAEGETTIEETVAPTDELVADAIESCDECTEDAACCCECRVRTIGRGPVSGFGLHSPRFRGLRMVIRDHETWAWFWEHHTAPLDPAPPLPEIDFEDSVVVVAILGVRTSGGGPAIGITRATRCEGATVIDVAVNNWPGPLEMITNPFHIAVVSNRCLPRWASALFVSHAPPHRPGMVVGRVLAADEPEARPVPLEGALVRLIQPGEEPEVVARRLTDEDGFYRFIDVRPGRYEIVAAAEGYAPRGWPVQVHSSHATVVDLILHPEEPPLAATGK